MDIVGFSIKKPVTVIVAVILIVLFGLISLDRLPYQLSPTVVEPDITVTTYWQGATPYEVEREIIEEQENTLKGIPGLTEMESTSSNGRGEITLKFKIGTDVDEALLRVSNKINEVRSYPEGVDKPIISATGSATSPVIWIVMHTMEGNTQPVETYKSFFEDEVRQHIERVDGVADLFIGGGIERQMHVEVYPDRLAAYGITINEIIAALRGENINISAGNLGVGRRDYRIRTTGELKTVGDIEGVVVRSTGQRRVFLRDLADVRRGFEKRNAVVFHNGKPGMAVGVKPEPGTNILEMTDRVQDAVNRLNAEVMNPIGINFKWVYDQRPYINGAIDLIKQNILIGGFLAVTVLMLFLRSVRATFVVATAIPISIIGTFIFLALMGRNLNVVSLAGIAFAVGMLVDSAIVVMENIDRHRSMGKDGFEAAYDGTREVWGAILASTLTTVAVFLPVVFLEEEAGQLFRDIAIAVVSSVTLSLFVSVSVIPMLSSRAFAMGGKKSSKGGGSIAKLGRDVAGYVMAMVSLALKNWRTRLVTVGVLVGIAVLTVLFLVPKKEYLPQGNRNFVLSILVPPPGLSLEEREDIGRGLFGVTGPYIGKDYHEGLPGIKNMFYVGAEGFMLFGAMSTQEQEAGKLVPFFQRTIFTIPGMYGVSLQVGIFQTRLGRGRTIEVNISGNDMNRIIQAAGMMYGKISPTIPRIRPVPSIELLYPEVRILPLRDRLKANGMSTGELGVALDVLMDGREIGEFKEEGKKKVDLVLKSPGDGISTPEDLYGSLLVTPGGKVVPVSSLSVLERTTGITQIRHLERDRTVTLEVTPPIEMPLQSAMETIEQDVIGPMKEQGMLEGVKVRMSGAADKLVETGKAMQWNFLLAALIAYLLMSALFGNFIYPVVIMLTVPLAGAGGLMGLKILNLFTGVESMDILTMLGFVILIGIVVNNAILIVHQALNNVRIGGMEYREAVIESTRSRLRPIYMSAMTSIFGMLPLVLFPGAGSELYRGLGSVILGGIAVSTVFTVFIIPSLLVFIIRMEGRGGESNA